MGVATKSLKSLCQMSKNCSQSVECLPLKRVELTAAQSKQKKKKRKKKSVKNTGQATVPKSGHVYISMIKKKGIYTEERVSFHPKVM